MRSAIPWLLSLAVAAPLVEEYESAATFETRVPFGMVARAEVVAGEHAIEGAFFEGALGVSLPLNEHLALEAGLGCDLLARDTVEATAALSWSF